MTTPQNMTTEELLRVATARPWRLHGNIGRKGEPGIFADDAPCIVAVMGNAKAWPDKAVANAELIARAVNSFEAMREAVANALTVADAIADGRFADVEHMVASLADETYKALTLADGKQP